MTTCDDTNPKGAALDELEQKGKQKTSTIPDQPEEDPQIVNPLVFQCINCKSIIGDSFSWLNIDRDLNAISLTSKSDNVQLNETMEFSNEGVDKGSAYMFLKCSSCAKVLGKSYKATPRKWDVIRDMFTFDLGSISSYQLGVDTPVPLDGAMEELVTMPSAMELRSTIDKIQEIILQLGERMDTLEQMVVARSTKDSTVSTPTGKRLRVSSDENVKHGNRC